MTFEIEPGPAKLGVNWHCHYHTLHCWSYFRVAAKLKGMIAGKVWVRYWHIQGYFETTLWVKLRGNSITEMFGVKYSQTCFAKCIVYMTCCAPKFLGNTSISFWLQASVDVNLSEIQMTQRNFRKLLKMRIR